MNITSKHLFQLAKSLANFKDLVLVGAGFVAAFALQQKGCIPKDTQYVFTRDTVYQESVFTKPDTVEVSIPVPVVKWYPVKVTDTIEVSNESAFADIVASGYATPAEAAALRSRIVELSKDTAEIVGFNMYGDSISTPDYKLIWSAIVHGELMDMTPIVSVNQSRSTVEQSAVVKQRYKPGLEVSAGFSSALTTKLGVGYRGWFVEGAFNNERAPEVYLTKRITLTQR